MFDPQKLPVEPEELAAYGIHEMEELCAHYGTPKIGQSGQELAPLLSTSNAEDEWIKFKQLMTSNYRSCTIQSMAEKLLTSNIIKEEYPNILTLITLALSLSVSTADCERGFSKYNFIKTKLRARVKPVNVGTLMLMSLDTPSLEDMETFNFSRAYTIWCNTKERFISK